MGEKHQVGLLVLHGNRLELLAEAVFTWLAANPLGPLEQETILVQSNGMAEWFKMELAGAHGVCASTTVELPARFIWRAYRARCSAAARCRERRRSTRLPLTWRLMHLLPSLLADQPGFEPVRGFLADGDASPTAVPARTTARRPVRPVPGLSRPDWLEDWGRRAATSSARVVKAGR
jgi:exodeoxyribonuclease V gamma subunit